MEMKWTFALVAIALVTGVVVGANIPRVVEPTMITVSGSTSVLPMVEALRVAFENINPHIRIAVGGGGSTVGIVQAHDGVVDIGMSSRELRPGELEWGLHVTEIAKDGVVPIVHPLNPVRNLTVEQVRKIYTREITNWNQVGGENAVIHVITREEGSGTRGTFEDIVMDDEEIWAGAIIQPSTGAVRDAVAGDRRAIGYISFAALDGTVRAPSIGGVPATIEDMRAGRYPIVRRFLLLTAEAPTGAVREFIDFILSEEGQRIVEDEDGIPVK